MKIANRQIISFLIILMMIFAAALGTAPVSNAADAPAIVFSEPDHKLAPGEGITVGITLETGVDDVVLEQRNADSSEWTVLGNCVSMDAGRTIWTFDLPAPEGGSEATLSLRFAVYYGEGASHILSKEFTIEWKEKEALIPEILYCSLDHWLWPGETFTVGVVTTEGSAGAVLEYLDEETGEWLKYDDCLKNEADGSWYYDLPPYPDEGSGGEGSIRFRFAVLHGLEGEPPVMSEAFTMYWTNDLGYERICGVNRYQTAFLTALEKLKLTGKTKYENVVIACGTDFADALGGTYLAAVKNAPILLVNDSDVIMGEVAEHVEQYLSPEGRIYILGGTAAVPEAMETALEEKGISKERMERFAGINRYDTNLKILNYCEPKGKDVLICCGTDFADVLSAAAVGRPILLAGKSMSPDQTDFIASMSPGSIYIIGGSGAVNETVEEQVNDLGADVYRVAGNNRYETSALVATEFFSERQRHYITLAYGLDFPDGLAGGPLCLDLYPEAPLLLVKEGAYGPAAAYVKYNGRTRCAKVLGGPGLIPDELVEKIVYVQRDN